MGTTQPDPSLTTTATSANLGCGAITGVTKSGTATIQWLAVVTYIGPAPPTSVSVPYKLINAASAYLTLGGLTPPVGAGRANAGVANAGADTSNIVRGTVDKQSYFYAGPLAQNKTKQMSIANWQQVDLNTYKAFVILESSTLTAQARIDAVGNAGPPIPVLGGGGGTPGGGPGPSPQVQGDQATASAVQSIGAP